MDISEMVICLATYIGYMTELHSSFPSTYLPDDFEQDLALRFMWLRLCTPPSPPMCCFCQVQSVCPLIEPSGTQLTRRHRGNTEGTD